MRKMVDGVIHQVCTVCEGKGVVPDIKGDYITFHMMQGLSSIDKYITKECPHCKGKKLTPVR